VPRFISPTTDLTFKLVFGQKKHNQLTMDFINDLLERAGDQRITHISFMDKENIPERVDDRLSAVDINCKDASGHEFIIEIQRKRQSFFDKRALYYTSSLLARQLSKGESFVLLRPVIFIGIMEFDFYGDKTYEDPISHHMICNMKTGKQSIDLIELHFIELPKFKKTVDQLVTQIDKWLFFLKNAQDLHKIPTVYEDSPSMQEAFNLMEQANFTKEELARYDREIERERIILTQELLDAQEKEQARIEKEQMQFDREQARLDREQARLDREQLQQLQLEKEQLQQRVLQTEQQKIQDMALIALKNGLDITLIAKLTGLSVDEIKNLKK